MEQSASLVTGSEKETKSFARLPRNRERFTKSSNRELAASLQQIADLKVKTDLLLRTLKNVAASPNLDLNESSDIMDVINNVGLQTTLSARLTDCS
jgi:hypothetical protein